MRKNCINCKIITLAIIYLTLPICIFFLFWLRLPWGVLSTVFLGYGCYKFNKEVSKKYEDLPISFNNELAFAFLVVFIFLLLTGNGSFIGSEGYDIPWRNAIYQDLINQPWPLVYETSESSLVYYLTYWLVPAGISYLCNLGETSRNIILVLWTYFGVRIFLQLLFNYLHVKKNQIIPITIMFLFWSGVYVLGAMIVKYFWSGPLVGTGGWECNYWWYTNFILDGYPLGYMVRPVYDSLSNIYNQFMPVLLSLMLFLITRNSKYYALIGLLVLPFSPFGFLGLFVIMFALFIIEVYQGVLKKSLGKVVRTILSVENILAALSICSVFWLYYTCNSNSESEALSFAAPLAYYGFVRTSILFLYYFLQFGILMVLIYWDTAEKKLWWITLLSLMLFPLLRVGKSTDLCWNGSIPGFYLLMIMVMQYVLHIWNNKQWNWRFSLVYAFLILGALSPLQQMTSQLGQCIQLRVLVVRAGHVNFGDTFSKIGREEAKKDFGNFLCLDYQDKAFYKYLAKKH